MSEEKKNSSAELTDEQLEKAAGGLLVPPPQPMKPCERCQTPIPANTTPAYCGNCLSELAKQGIYPRA